MDIPPGPKSTDRAGLRYYDAKTGEWRDSEPRNSEVDYTVASCEIPTQVIKGPPPNMNSTSLVKPPHKYESPTPNPKTGSINSGPGDTGYKSYVYDPAKPWEGLDRFKYPATWHLLLKLYFDREWWKFGIYIPDEEYRDRVLRGVYIKRSPGYRHYTEWQTDYE